MAFIGTRDTWARWSPFLKEKGFAIYLVEGIDVEPIEGLEEKISMAIGRRYSSAIFTSKNAVKILMSRDVGKELVERLYGGGSLLVSIGEGTENALRSYGYRSLTPPIERVNEAIRIVDTILRSGGRIALLSSDRLDLDLNVYQHEIDHMRVYRIIRRSGDTEAVRELVKKGIRRFIIASQTASEILAEAIAREDLHGVVEAHVISSRAAQPLTELGVRGMLRVFIYESPSFREFILSITRNVSSLK
ncbi:MAG: uroporphyrinogen-III synthase [Desulfurococcales archaeon]|nr:uroporphyrinogen-III synthase [Desulfurococcales archaeon]